MQWEVVYVIKFLSLLVLFLFLKSFWLLRGILHNIYLSFLLMSHQEAVKLLLCQNFITQNDDPMYDYHYEGNEEKSTFMTCFYFPYWQLSTVLHFIIGSVRWASKERQIFRQNFRTKGKEFSDLQKDVSFTPYCYNYFMPGLQDLSYCWIFLFLRSLIV